MIGNPDIEEKKDLLKNALADVSYGRDLLKKYEASAKEALMNIAEDDFIPLYERWCIYLNNCNVLPMAGDVIYGQIEIYFSSVQADSYQRHQRVWFDGMFEDYHERDRNTYTEEQKTMIRTEFDSLPISLIKAVISSGYCGFVNDW